MSIEQAATFFLFAVVAAVTPGPSNVMVTAAGAAVGIVRGLPCLLGVTTGMGLMMFLVPLGLGSAVLGSGWALPVFKSVGSAFLLWMAFKIATSSGNDDAPAADPVGFLAAAAFQWVNPKSWLVAASAAGTFLEAGSGSALSQSASLGVLFFLAALPSCFLWLAFGAGVQRVLQSPSRRRTFNVVMGMALALSVVVILA